MRPIAIIIALFTVVTVEQVIAADPHLGRNLAAVCANCHGTDGKAQGAMIPLAGRSADDIVSKLSEFKAGKREATIMHQIARGFTDEQLKLVAEYFAKQK